MQGSECNEARGSGRRQVRHNGKGIAGLHQSVDDFQIVAEKHLIRVPFGHHLVLHGKQCRRIDGRRTGGDPPAVFHLFDGQLIVGSQRMVRVQMQTRGQRASSR